MIKMVLVFLLFPLVVHSKEDILCNDSSNTEFYATMMRRQRFLKQPLTALYQQVDSDLKTAINSLCPVYYTDSSNFSAARSKVLVTCESSCLKKEGSAKNPTFGAECKRICDVLDEKLQSFRHGVEYQNAKHQESIRVISGDGPMPSREREPLVAPKNRN